MLAGQYQASMGQKTADVTKQKLGAIPALLPSKYTASQKKDEADTQGQESDDKYDAMMEN